jgi:hypothetical protein
MESFFALLQHNVLNHRSWATRNELRLAIITWIERPTTAADGNARSASSPRSSSKPSSTTLTSLKQHDPHNRRQPKSGQTRDTVRHRLSRSGNRQLNTALHVAAHVQRSHSGSGRDYYLRKIAEGKSRREAMRCLKRQIAERVYRQLRADHDTAHQPLLEPAA